jgi:hypothetical protein
MEIRNPFEEARPPETPRCKVLITAACRSGTKYTAECFKKCGVNATHETVFHELEFTRWGNTELEVSCWAPHYVTADNTRDVFLVHQTRNPIDSINSNAAHWEHLLRDQFTDYFRDITKQADHKKFPRMLRYKEPYEKALAYYVYQNSFIENRMQPRFRAKVEEIFEWLPKIFKQWGQDTIKVNDTLDVPNNFNQLPDYVNRDKFDADFEDLPNIPEKKSLQEMIERYGYAV